MDSGILLRVLIAFEKFLSAFADILPLIFFSLLLAFILSVFVKKEAREFSFLEISFFCLLGCIIAYLTFLSSNTILENLLPSIIILLTFLFKFFIEPKNSKNIKYNKVTVYLAGASLTLSFIVSSRYFSLHMGSASVG